MRKGEGLTPRPPVPTLIEVMENKVLPWLESATPPPLLVAQPTLREFLRKNEPLPAGVTYKQQTLRSRPVRVRRNPQHILFETVVAQWPLDRLVASRDPILLCPFDQAADIRIGNYLLHLPEGSFFLLPPESPRTDGTEPHLPADCGPDERCDVLWLEGGAAGIQVWACHTRAQVHWIGSITARVVVHHPQAHFFFTSLLDAALTPGRESRLICHGALKMLLGIVARDLRANSFQPTGSLWQPAPEIAAGWNPIGHAQDYIRHYQSERLTIESVARVVYMSPSRFTARFRRETGMTFNTFLTQVRMERAQALLRDTNWSVTQITRAVGLHPSQLRRLLKRETNLNPLALRRRAHQGGSASRRAAGRVADIPSTLAE